MTVPDLNAVDAAFRTSVAARLPPSSIGEYSARFSEDPRGLYSCADALVIQPADADEVATVLKLCNAARVPVVPFGGGTGLVGGQIGHDLPTPVVLSMHRMDAIRDLAVADCALTAEAGCILQDIQTRAAEQDFTYPIAIPSRGSCQIGGLLATNAGGSGALRYGSVRDRCLGIEAVFADGSIWSRLEPLHKDNHGYDLRNLLIGSEGTLAVITAATLKLCLPTEPRLACFLELRDLAAAEETLDMFRRHPGSRLAAFELISGVGLEFLLETGLKQALPVATIPEWAALALIDCEGDPGQQHSTDAMVSKLLDDGVIVDGTMTTSGRVTEQIWELRELIPEANKRIGSLVSHDISVPISSLTRFIPEAGAALAKLGPYRINCFGHYGDGNLHYNVFPPKGGTATPAERDAVADCVYGLVQSYGGSIAAEHGTGRMKAVRLRDDGDPTFYRIVKSIKQTLDPHGILNPGAIVV